jgi:hypothetical protein
MRTQGEFDANGTVSVWIGNFSSEVEFDDYMNLSREFEADFGFKIENGSIREGAVEEHALPIEKLAVGFSYGQSFAAAVAEACQNLGVTKATTMIVFYTTHFKPSMVRINPRARLMFVGSFPFQ